MIFPTFSGIGGNSSESGNGGGGIRGMHFSVDVWRAAISDCCIGLGKPSGNILVSKHWLGCVVSLISKWTGNHPRHLRAEPPTASIHFLQGIYSSGRILTIDKCLGPAIHILGQESGEMIITAVLECGNCFALGETVSTNFSMWQDTVLKLSLL